MRKYFFLFFFFFEVGAFSVQAQSPQSVYDKASQYYSSGKMDSALNLLLAFQSIISKDSGTNGYAYAGFLDQLATLYSVMRDPEHGLPVAYEALNMYRKIESDSSLNFANAMVNLINLNLHKMELASVEKQIDTALAIYIKRVGESSLEWSTLMNSKGVYYQYAGQTDKSLLTFLELREKAKRYYPDRFEDLAFYQLNISNLYVELGLYKKAKQQVEDLESLFKNKLGVQHPLYVNCLLSRGKLELFTFQKEKAHATFLEAKSMIGSNGENSDLEQYVDNNLAYTDFELLRFDTAIVLYKKVMAKWNRRGMGKSIYAGRTLFNMSLAYFMKNDYDNAYKAINDALEVFKNLNKDLDLDYSSSFILKSTIQLHQKDFANALETYNKGLDLNFRYWKYASSSLGFNDQFNFMNYLGLAFDFLTHQLELNPSLRKDTTALQSLFKQQVLLSNSVASIQPTVRYEDEELNTLIKESEQLKHDYAALYVSNPTAKTPLSELQSQIDLYDLKINSRYSDNKFKTGLEAFGYQDIIDKLTDNEVLIKIIKYSYFDRNKKVNAYCALIFKKSSKTPIFELLGSEATINRALQKKASDGRLYYNGYIDLNKSLATSKNETYRKYIDRYWKSIVQHINPGNSVYFIPDGLFQKVAFAALPYRGTALMIDQTNTRIFYDFTSFLNRSKSSIQDQLSVGIWGGMNYNANKRGSAGATQPDLNAPVIERGSAGVPINWTNLKNSSGEIAEIASKLKTAKLSFQTFTGDAATEESFKSQIGKWKVLHLSTHGYSFGSQVSKQDQYVKVPDINYTESWLKSGIVFSGANTFWGRDTLAVDRDNGVLTSLEVIGLNLSSTELLVMSACETALGAEVSNNYLIGMPSALKLAGAKRLLLSLWNVPDKETKELIQLFYTYLVQSKSPEAALRAAQKKMKSQYTPYYWAGFIVIE